MRRFIGFLTILTCLVWVSVSASGDALAAEPEFKAHYATQLSKTFHLTEADYKFAELVAQKTNGRLKIEVFPAGQLYKDRGIVKAITDGALEMGIIYSGAWNGQLPYIDIFDVPFVFSSLEDIHKSITGRFGEIISQDMAKYNAKLLYVGYYGRSFEIANSIRPLKVPADFKGLKIRCNLPTAVASMKALNAAPLKMSSSEVYMALQRKTIDGVVSGVQSIIKRKWNESCKYLTATEGTFSPWLVTVNLKFWNKLPEDIQQQVLEAAAEISRETLTRADSEDAMAMEEAKKTMEIFYLKEPWPEAREAGLAEWKKHAGEEKAEEILKIISAK